VCTTDADCVAGKKCTLVTNGAAGHRTGTYTCQ
jgi:hypothetical protein